MMKRKPDQRAASQLDRTYELGKETYLQHSLYKNVIGRFQHENTPAETNALNKERHNLQLISVRLVNC